MEYVPGAAVVNLIVEELLTEEYKELLSIRSGTVVIDVGYQLMERFGKMWAIGSLSKCKIKAAGIIHRNKYNYDKLRRFEDILAKADDPEKFGLLVKTTPELIEVVNQMGVNSKGSTMLNGISTKARAGESDTSEESEKTDDWDQENREFIQNVTSKRVDSAINIQANQVQETGEFSIEFTPNADTTPSIALPPERGENIQMHGINVNTTQTLNYLNTMSNDKSGIKKSRTNKGKTETLKIIQSQSVKNYLNFYIVDLRGKLIDQFATLFTEYRRCQ